MLTTAFEQIYYVFLLDRHEPRSGDGDDGPRFSSVIGRWQFCFRIDSYLGQIPLT
jgi:hypothetical protein